MALEDKKPIYSEDNLRITLQYDMKSKKKGEKSILYYNRSCPPAARLNPYLMGRQLMGSL